LTFRVRTFRGLSDFIEKGFRDIDPLTAIPELMPLRERMDFKALGL
jgi:hypothetical protein